MSSYIMPSPIDSENYFHEEEGAMDSPSQQRRRSGSSSQRKSGGVVRALRELGKRPWLPSPLDAATKWLTPSYETKNEDFRRLFKSLPPNAMLLDDYSCALQRDILVHGRMYVSQDHVSFYANIFGWETIVVIPLKRITSVTREKTAHVFPNAIQILLSDGVEINGTFSSDPKPHSSTGATGATAPAPVETSGETDRTTRHNKLWFTSFVSRDTTHTVLMKAWQNVLVDSPLSPVQLRNFACRCWGEKPDVTPAMARAIMSDASIVAGDTGSASTGSDFASSGSVCGDATVAADTGDFELVQQSSEAKDKQESVDMESCEPVVEDTMPEPDEPVQCGCTVHKETYLNQTFNCSVDILFQLLFTNSEFYKVFCREHKTIDLRMQEWTPTDGDGQRREVTYTLTLNKTMGPKFSPTTETQHCLEGSSPGKMYRVDVEVCNGGIPYGDVFCTEHRYCLTYLSRFQSHLHVGADIHYRKSCWGLVKTFIERHCFQGMESYYKDLANSLDEECLKLPTPAGVNSHRPSRSPSLSGSLASLPSDKASSASVQQDQLSESSTPAADNVNAVCRCGASISSGKRSGSSRSTSPAQLSSAASAPALSEPVWTFSNILMVCLLVALILNILLLLRLTFHTPVMLNQAQSFGSAEDVFAAQLDQWKAAMFRRQQALQTSFDAFPQLSQGVADYLVPPLEDK
ncbi:protein Aster-B-like [Sycon ciliatum]|uniref:protein Aster-B-like n=1 Tax=Sycon ciliatum TaxID=27933 RepID=UPI0020AA2BB5|eukprot:scpid35423/ scgid34912/ GRAM domain-containing protein 1B